VQRPRGGKEFGVLKQQREEAGVTTENGSGGEPWARSPCRAYHGFGVSILRAMEVTEGRFFFFNFYLFTSFWTFLAVLGLHCCARAFSSCGKWGLLFVVVFGLLVMVASLMGALGCLGFGSCPLQRGFQWLWCTGLVARWHTGYSWIRD